MDREFANYAYDDDEDDFRGMQLVLYDADIEARFECLYIGNIPICRDIRRILFEALQRFTGEFGPIVRFRMPGPTSNRRCRECHARQDDAQPSLHAYVYFRSTRAPHAIVARAHQIAADVPIHGFPLSFAVDRPTSEFTNPGQPVDPQVIARDILVVPEHRQCMQVSFEEARQTFYDCPRCWRRTRLDHKTAHEQICVGVVNDAARELRELRKGLSDAMRTDEQDNLLLLMARLRCTSCKRKLWQLSAREVTCLKCGHFVCRDCLRIREDYVYL